MTPDKKWYLRRIIGKVVVCILWIVMIVINLVCINGMRLNEFKAWIMLSVLTYFVIIFVVDSLLYLLLVCLLVREKRYLNFYTSKKESCGRRYGFIFVFIGRDKLKDLKRAWEN